MFKHESSSSEDDDNGTRRKFEPIAAAATAQAARLARRTRQNAQAVAQTHAQHDVNEYDAAYHTVQQSRQQRRAELNREARARNSRYIGMLVEKADLRKEEAERVAERRMVREREKEDGLYEGKERFVTGAYKRKLAERAVMDGKERLEEERFGKGGDVSQFYRGLYGGTNVALGGSAVRASGEPDGDSAAERGAMREYREVAESQKAELPQQRAPGAALEQLSSKGEGRRRSKRSRFGDTVAAKNPGAMEVAVAPPKKPALRGLRRNDEKAIEAYRQRYFARRALKLAAKKG